MTRFAELAATYHADPVVAHIAPALDLVGLEHETLDFAAITYVFALLGNGERDSYAANWAERVNEHLAMLGADLDEQSYEEERERAFEQEAMTQGEWMTEAFREYAGTHGAADTTRAWILTPYDTWERNPFYVGEPQRHPEDDHGEFDEERSPTERWLDGLAAYEDRCDADDDIPF